MIVNESDNRKIVEMDEKEDQDEGEKEEDKLVWGVVVKQVAEKQIALEKKSADKNVVRKKREKR
jgi:hypothetical protein